MLNKIFVNLVISLFCIKKTSAKICVYLRIISFVVRNLRERKKKRSPHDAGETLSPSRHLVNAFVQPFNVFYRGITVLSTGGIKRRVQQRTGCSKSLCALFCVIPVQFPLVSVEYGAEGCHVVDAADSPPCPGLFQAFADQIFAGPLDLAAIADVFQAVINIQYFVTFRKCQRRRIPYPMRAVGQNRNRFIGKSEPRRLRSGRSGIDSQSLRPLVDTRGSDYGGHGVTALPFFNAGERHRSVRLRQFPRGPLIRMNAFTTLAIGKNAGKANTRCIGASL